MKKTQFLTLKSETGKKVSEEVFTLGSKETERSVTVRYTFDYALNSKPTQVIYQILDGENHTTGNFGITGLNISNYNSEYAALYVEIEATCKEIVK